MSNGAERFAQVTVGQPPSISFCSVKHSQSNSSLVPGEGAGRKDHTGHRFSVAEAQRVLATGNWGCRALVSSCIPECSSLRVFLRIRRSQLDHVTHRILSTSGRVCRFGSAARLPFQPEDRNAARGGWAANYMRSVCGCYVDSLSVLGRTRAAMVREAQGSFRLGGGRRQNMRSRQTGLMHLFSGAHGLLLT